MTRACILAVAAVVALLAGLPAAAQQELELVPLVPHPPAPSQPQPQPAPPQVPPPQLPAPAQPPEPKKPTPPATPIAFPAPAQKAEKMPVVPPPLKGHPDRFLRYEDGEIFAKMSDHRVYQMPTGARDSTAPIVIDMNGHDGCTVTDSVCAAGPKGYVACLYKGFRIQRTGNQIRLTKRLGFIDSAGKAFVVGEGAADDGYDIAPLGIYCSRSDAVYAFSETVKAGKQIQTTDYLVAKGRSTLDLGQRSLAASLAPKGGGRDDPRIQFVEFRGTPWMVYQRSPDTAVLGVSIPADTGIAVQPVGSRDIFFAAKSALYDIRPVVTSDGWFYIFYYAPGANTAMVAASRDGKVWAEIPLDTEESGWQIEADALKDAAVGVFYYYRNSFNKGLKAVVLSQGKIVQPAHVLFRERDFNTGWNPALAVANDGSIWLTFLHKVEDKTRLWARFESPAAFTATRVPPGQGWEERYKAWSLQAGLGGWYTFWSVQEIAAAASDTGGKKISPANLDIANSLLTSVSFEARLLSTQLALGYARSLFNDISKSIGNGAGVLNGSIKVDKLLPGHDVKVQTVWGRYAGKATQNVRGDVRVEAPFDTDYIDTQAIFLNKWRIKYGLVYTQYNLPVTIHSWVAPKGSTAYEYGGSFFRDVTFREAKAMFGYSKLDYAAKYENVYLGPILDAYLDFGVSVMDWPAITTLQGTKASSGLTFVSRVSLAPGLLFLRRWHNARGLGLYVRPTYMLDFNWVGLTPSKPKDRDADAAGASSATTASPSLVSFRHGPWIDLGVVW